MAAPTADDVAAHLGLVADTRMTQCVDAGNAWVERQRSLTPPGLLWSQPDVFLGAVLYGALLYLARVTPQGMAGYAELGTYNADTWEALQRVRDLVSEDPVVG
jgi:hypothetical protein